MQNAYIPVILAPVGVVTDVEAVGLTGEGVSTGDCTAAAVDTVLPFPALFRK